MKPTPSLRSSAADLETKTFSVSRLLEALRKGQVRIPRFQRGFRWHDEDRRLLFDSIQSGYPLGTLLLAKGDAPPDRVMLGGFVAEVGADKEALWVVDGQQRLATLAMALLEDHSGSYRPIFFDLIQNEFVLGNRKKGSPSHWVPTHVLANSASLIKWLRDADLDNHLSDRADEIARCIREYAMPAYLVPYDGQDDHLLREIFARTNQRGRRLRSHEVFDALHATLRGDRGPISRVQDDLAELGFGPLVPQDIERASIAVSGATPHGGGHQMQEIAHGQELDILLIDVTNGLARAIEFLSQDAGVPHVDWLPYRGVLATLARFFAIHPNPHERNRDLLVRWFWRGTMSGDHKTDNAVDSKKWKCITENEHSSVQSLLRLLPKLDLNATTKTLGTFRSNSATSRVELLAMISISPRILFGDGEGSEVPVAPLITSKDHFPFLFARGENNHRTLAHYILHPNFDIDDFKKENISQTLLNSHGINSDAYLAYMENDMTKFIQLRTQTLNDNLQVFLANKLAITPPDRDRPPIESYT
jgi:hypothetical protein